jgi:small subunit ribosomal protein S21|tara:strand:- start:207 stop:476 length:270 start_codon:yes stop_codon:yes gene_type:complete
MKYKQINKFKKKPFKREERPSGMTVMVRDNDVNKAMRVLKKKLLNDGFFQELRDRTFYESKGTKRRKAKDVATRRFKKNQAKLKLERGY